MGLFLAVEGLRLGGNKWGRWVHVRESEIVLGLEAGLAVSAWGGLE